jgi:hypothetical protein
MTPETASGRSLCAIWGGPRTHPGCAIALCHASNRSKTACASGYLYPAMNARSGMA